MTKIYIFSTEEIFSHFKFLPFLICGLLNTQTWTGADCVHLVPCTVQSVPSELALGLDPGTPGMCTWSCCRELRE